MPYCDRVEPPSAFCSDHSQLEALQMALAPNATPPLTWPALLKRLQAAAVHKAVPSPALADSGVCWIPCLLCTPYSLMRMIQ